MSHHREPDEDLTPAVRRVPSDRLRFDEGNAIAARLDDLEDSSERESFDDVFDEFDERFGSE